ncbi:MAG: gliding motility-associated C-terminal domain-containing protein, partial [Bacteroidota bacterium]
ASYIWSNGSTDPTILVEESGFYAVTITTDCRIFEDDIALDFIPPIAYDLGPDQFLCSSQIFLDAATQGFAEYLWSDGSDLPFLIAGEPGIYTVNVFNQCESVTQEVELFECEQCDIYFPNVFSPNFDGINDNFRPASDCELLDYDLAIFDRWGGLLFQTDDPFDGWDGIVRGQQLPNATYVWRAQFTVIENNIPRRVEASGDVIILK